MSGADKLSSSPSHCEMAPQPASFREPAPLVSEADRINPLARVADVMNKNAATCKASTPLVEALSLLRDSVAGAVPVVHRGRPIGFLTARRAIAAIYERPRDWELLAAADVIERGPQSAAADDGLEIIFERFHPGGMVVADDEGMLIGVVGWRELDGYISERGMGRVVRSVFKREGSD